MAGFNPNNFNDRAAAAARARQAMIERFRAAPGPDDPRIQEIAAQAKEAAEARERRAAERRAFKIAEEERVKAEAEAAAAEKVRRELEERAAILARRRAALAEQKAAKEAAKDVKKLRK